MFDLNSKSESNQKNGLPTPPNEQPPPSYTVNDSRQVPDITAAFSNLDLTASHTKSAPSADHCIAHLKLLESLHQLREEVALTDGLFGIRDAFVPPNLSESDRASLLTKIREKRWAVYVAKATDRFKTWWEKCVETHAHRVRQADLPVIFAKSDPTGGPVLAFNSKHIPPLGKLH